jgi:hypothetical protein
MTDYTTGKDVRVQAQRLAEALGKKFSVNGDCWDRKENKAIVGCWIVDCNPTYGGCIIEEMFNEHGAVSHPIMELRQPPRELVQSIRFALRVLEIEREE